MSEDPPTLLGVLSAGFSPALVALCVVSGLGIGFLSAPAAPATAATTAKTSPSPAPPDEPDDSSPDEVDTPDEPDEGTVLSVKQIRDLIATGKFAEAERAAKAAGENGLLEEAHLFNALTDRIQPGALARAKSLEEIQVAGQQRIGVVKHEDADLVQLIRYDGAPIDLPAQGLEVRRTLHGMEARRVLADRLRADREKVGDAGGLTIHRYAFWAFRAGLRRLGTEFLREAIRSDEGRVLVDMFGSGDYERLQRGRLVVCGALPPPNTARPRPKPPTTTKRPPTTTKPPPTTTKPPSASGVTVVDPLAEDEDWLLAEAAYEAGVRHYRSAFGQVGAPGLKRAIARFREAQDLINPLLDAYDGEPAQRLERRLVELNTLIYDCAKQGGVR